MWRLHFWHIFGVRHIAAHVFCHVALVCCIFVCCIFMIVICLSFFILSVSSFLVFVSSIWFAVLRVVVVDFGMEAGRVSGCCVCHVWFSMHRMFFSCSVLIILTSSIVGSLQ